MKNSEIHIGLDKKEIRDFLSLGLVRAYEQEFINKKETIPYSENSFQWAIKDTEAQIKYLQRYLEILRIKEAIIQIIHTSGWQEFDVSEETINDMPYKMKMNFIGSEKEHQEFLMKLK